MMAKASRKRRGQGAEATTRQTAKPRREIWGIAPNGEFVVRDENGNRVAVDPNAKVMFGKPLTPEQLEFLARLPVKAATAGDLVRSSIREKTESWEQRREAQRQKEFQEKYDALADAIASRVERPKSNAQRGAASEKARRNRNAGSTAKRGRKPATEDQIEEACEVRIEYQRSGKSRKDFCAWWSRDKKVGSVGVKWLAKKLALIRKLLSESPERIPKRFANKFKPLRRVKRAV